MPFVPRQEVTSAELTIDSWVSPGGFLQNPGPPGQMNSGLIVRGDFCGVEPVELPCNVVSGKFLGVGYPDRIGSSYSL